MALAIHTFFGLECGGEYEFAGKSATVYASDFKTDITPPHDGERWTVQWGDRSPYAYLRQKYITPAGGIFFSIFVRFSNTNPNSGFVFLSGVTKGNDYDIQIKINTDGTISILDATGATVDTSSATPFTNSVWHRVDLYWERDNNGDAAVAVDGVTTNTVSGEDFLNDSGDTDVAIEISGQPGVASSSCITTFNSGYYGSGVAGIAFGMEDFVVVGVFQTYHDTGVADNGGDTLDNGTKWIGMAFIPKQAMPYAQYTGTHEGYTATNGEKRAGPKYDGRLAFGEIKAVSFTFSAGQADAVAQCGKFDGDSTYTVDEWGTLADNSNTLIVYNADSSYAPSKDDYAVIGFRCAGGARGSVISEAWVSVLKEAADPNRVYIKGAEIQGCEIGDG